MTALALLALVCAAAPAALFLRNLRIFSCPADGDPTPVSILIPARNEEINIAAAVLAALATEHAEVLVLDDGSTDHTAAIVRDIAVREKRVRLLTGQPLPAGWFGKNFACAQLAAAAANPILLFVDADVRLAPDGVARMTSGLKAAGADLISGVPAQDVGTFSEMLLVPLIHFVLLAFLPLARMRQSPHVAYATGCGQLIMTEAAAYRRSGGHDAIRGAIHDGLALPRKFRKRGLRTDLLDATDLATCRMYRKNGDVWRGLLKNTHEGLGAPARIVPLTLFLGAGQILPVLLLIFARHLTPFALIASLVAVTVASVPRLVGLRRFRQPMLSALLHPIGIACLLAIQWLGLARFLLKQPARWKGRAYT